MALRPAPDHEAQDGGAAFKSAAAKHREAVQKLFPQSDVWDLPETNGNGTESRSGSQSEADNTVPLEDPHAALLPWDTVSNLPMPQRSHKAHTASSPEQEPTLRDIFSAVTSCNLSITALASEVKGMKTEMSFLRQDMQKLKDRTSAIEGRISIIEDDWAPMQRDTHAQQIMVAKHAAKLDDLENMLRRNNVRAIGIPEKMEGRNPVDFIEKWLLDKFGKDAFSPMFAVERAHRVPSRPLPPGNPPRAFLFKMLHYRDIIILSKARTLGDALVIENSKISLFPDFSADVQKQRAQFNDIKKRLRSLELQYSMLYPARLRVVARDEVHFFERPAMVAQWLDREEKSLREDLGRRRRNT